MRNVETMYATCDTTGCDNASQVIRVLKQPGVTIICGVCDRPIMATTDTKPDETPGGTNDGNS